MNARRLVMGLVIVALATAGLAAQRRGGGGRGGLNIGARGRMDTLALAFDLDKDQRKTIKAVLDEGFASAAPVRAELKKTRAALGAAAIGTDAAALETATKAYAVQAAAMTAIEMRAFAEVLKPLSPAQKAKGTALAFVLMRTAFLDDKKWDDIPSVHSY